MCLSKSKHDDSMTIVSVEEEHRISRVNGACVRVLFKGVRASLVKGGAL